MAMTRKVSSTSSRFGRLSESSSTRPPGARADSSTASRTPANESRLRSLSPCLNSAQPCLYRLWL